MSDVHQEPEGLEGTPPIPSFNSTYLDDVEVIIEDPAGQPAIKPEEVEAMKAKLAEQEKQINDLKTQGDTARAVQSGIAALAQGLKPASTPTPQPQIVQQPGESPEAFRKRLDEGLLERGITSTMEEYYGKVLRPEVQHLLQGNLTNSRRFVVLDPQRGPLYQKYKSDVEAAVATLPAEAKLYDPEVYEKAVDRIAALHANEIIDEQVNARVQAELEKIKVQQAASAPKPGPNPAVAAVVGQRPAPTAGKTTVSLTPEEAKYAKDHMIPPHEYAAYLKRKGLKK